MEVWRKIPGYEGFYEVSDAGRVRRLRTNVSHANRWGMIDRYVRERILKQTDHRGHKRVVLYRESKRKVWFVHRLVALAFLGPQPPEKDMVAHRDGIHGHNTPENLYYATAAENSADAIRHGKQVRGERMPQAKMTAEKVREARRLRLSGLSYQRIADQFSVTARCIILIDNGKTWSHVQ